MKRFLSLLLVFSVLAALLCPAAAAKENVYTILVTENWVPSEKHLGGAKILCSASAGTSFAFLLESEGEFRLTVQQESVGKASGSYWDKVIASGSFCSITPVEDAEVLEGESRSWYCVPSLSGTLFLPTENGRLTPYHPREGLTDVALGLKGSPYVWAGESKSGFDCSGFTRYVYRLAGIDLPHSCNAQLELGEEVSLDELEIGDVIFFEKTYETEGASHVGIYVGDGKYLHASSSAGYVKTNEIDDPYFDRHFLACRRYL